MALARSSLPARTTTSTRQRTSRRPSSTREQINFTLQGATTQFEATGDSPFGPVFGLADPFSIGALDLTSDSRMTLENLAENHATPGDVVFANSFSIDDTSLLDIHGVSIWVSGNDVAALDSDIAAGLIIDSVMRPGEILKAQFVSSLDATTLTVPEPATWAMALIGFAGIGLVRRRSRRAVSTILRAAAEASASECLIAASTIFRH